jgi:hypothetical protein
MVTASKKQPEAKVFVGIVVTIGLHSKGRQHRSVQSLGMSWETSVVEFSFTKQKPIIT